VTSLSIARALAIAADGDAAALSALARDHGGAALRAKTGQAIFYESDPADAVYLLVEGVVITSVSFGEDEESERTTSILRAPAIFGDRDILADVSARESAEAYSAASLLLWDRAALLAQWETDPELRARLGRDLAARYAKSCALASIFIAPLAHRIAAILRDEAEAGVKEAAPVERIAKITRAAPKSVLRALAALREQQAIGESGLTLDESKLAQLGVTRTPISHTLRSAPLQTES
jgi:CRP-like cAMP-binding protein